MDPVCSPLIELIDGDVVLEWRAWGDTAVCVAAQHSHSWENL